MSANVSRRLLIVEDDRGLQRQLKWHFAAFDVATASTREEAIEKIRRLRPPVVTLDLGLPPDPDGATEGLATIEQILALAPATKIIVASGNAERDNAVRAIGLGAYDFCPKPVDPTILGLIVERAYHVFELEVENERLRQNDSASPLDGIITASPLMLQVCRMVEKVAPAQVSVLLLGESGTGKELMARALHRLSLRAKEPFVAINCAAIPETLLESELFGFEKGAFTGAVKQTLGRFELANGGTLFLDEIGDLPKSLQVKLLRFLQERVIERIGGRTPISLDVRVVSATHRDLAELIRQDAFREDLYYRISELSIEIPPLREREGDPPLLARVLLDQIAKREKRRVRGFTPEAIAAIDAYPWPGNVRELENRIKRAVILADDKLVTLADLDLKALESGESLPTLREARSRAEAEILRKALALTDGNLAEVARRLGVSRPTVYDLLKQHNLAPGLSAAAEDGRS